MERIYEWFDLGGDALGIAVFWLLVILAVIIIAAIVAGLHSLIDDLTGTWQNVYGVVIDKSHKEATSSTGVGYGLTTGGQMAAVVTSSSSPEEWFLIVRMDYTNKVEKLEASMQEVYDTPIGTKLNMREKIGGLSKSSLSIETI